MGYPTASSADRSRAIRPTDAQTALLASLPARTVTDAAMSLGASPPTGEERSLARPNEPLRSSPQALDDAIAYHRDEVMPKAQHTEG